MAKSILSADSAPFPALILFSFAGLQPPPGGPRPPSAAHSAQLTAHTRN